MATWERELAEGDYSSGVVVRAVESGVVSVDELRALRRDPSDEAVDSIAERIREAGIEAEFVDCWRREYEAGTEYYGEIDAVDVRAYLDGFDPIFRSQLTRGQ